MKYARPGESLVEPDDNQCWFQRQPAERHIRCVFLHEYGDYNNSLIVCKVKARFSRCVALLDAGSRCVRSIPTNGLALRLGRGRRQVGIEDRVDDQHEYGARHDHGDLVPAIGGGQRFCFDCLA